MHLTGLPRNDVLDGSGQDVAIMGQAGGERRTVVESELWSVLALLEGGLERVQLGPQLQDFLFLSREIDGGWNGAAHPGGLAGQLQAQKLTEGFQSNDQ